MIREVSISLGTAIFASVVLILAVFHETFRKVFLVAVGVGANIAGGFYLSLYLYHLHQERVGVEAKLQLDRKIKECVNRFPNADIFIKVACTDDPNASPSPAPISTGSLVKLNGRKF